MAIKSYLKNGKKLYEVVVKERDTSGVQVMRKRVGITSERLAKDVEFELKKDVEMLINKKPQTTWSKWFEHCMELMRTQFLRSTIMNYEAINSRWVRPIWGEKELSEISRLDVHRLVFDEIPEELSMGTRRNVLKAIRKILQVAVDDGVLNKNPTAGVTVRVPEVEQKVLTSAEVQTLLTKANEIEHPFYPIWFFAIHTGMRSGEMLALKWTDIDFDREVISVSKSWSRINGFKETKNGKSRIVPISDNLATFLKQLRLSSIEKDSFVLPRIREWEHSEQSRVIKGFCRAIGITPIKFHDLRATFITHMLASGVSLVRVMSIVGHSELKTTNEYLRKAGVDVVGATNALQFAIPEIKVAKILKFGINSQ